MEQWHIEGVRGYRKGRPAGNVRWRWRCIGSRGRVITEANRTFRGIAQCLEDAKRHGYASRI